MGEVYRAHDPRVGRDSFPMRSIDTPAIAHQARNEVYVRTFPPPALGHGGKWQVSNNGGTLPRWSRSGHDLMYQMGDQIMAASYTVKGDAFVAEKPRVRITKLGALFPFFRCGI